jgi:hypothetical protein
VSHTCLTAATMSEVPVVSLTLSPQWMALSQHAFHEVQPTHLRDLLKDADRCAALHSTLPLADPYARAARCVAPLEWAVPHWCAPDVRMVGCKGHASHCPAGREGMTHTLCIGYTRARIASVSPDTLIASPPVQGRLTVPPAPPVGWTLYAHTPPTPHGSPCYCLTSPGCGRSCFVAPLTATQSPTDAV